jgi:hypothetical protein
VTDEDQTNHGICPVYRDSFLCLFDQDHPLYPKDANGSPVNPVFTSGSGGSRMPGAGGAGSGNKRKGGLSKQKSANIMKRSESLGALASLTTTATAVATAAAAGSVGGVSAGGSGCGSGYGSMAPSVAASPVRPGGSSASHSPTPTRSDVGLAIGGGGTSNSNNNSNNNSFYGIAAVEHASSHVADSGVSDGATANVSGSTQGVLQNESGTVGSAGASSAFSCASPSHNSQSHSFNYSYNSNNNNSNGNSLNFATAAGVLGSLGALGPPSALGSGSREFTVRAIKSSPLRPKMMEWEKQYQYQLQQQMQVPPYLGRVPEEEGEEEGGRGESKGKVGAIGSSNSTGNGVVIGGDEGGKSTCLHPHEEQLLLAAKGIVPMSSPSVAVASTSGSVSNNHIPAPPLAAAVGAAGASGAPGPSVVYSPGGGSYSSRIGKTARERTQEMREQRARSYSASVSASAAGKGDGIAASGNARARELHVHTGADGTEYVTQSGLRGLGGGGGGGDFYYADEGGEGGAGAEGLYRMGMGVGLSLSRDEAEEGEREQQQEEEKDRKKRGLAMGAPRTLMQAGGVGSGAGGAGSAGGSGHRTMSTSDATAKVAYPGLREGAFRVHSVAYDGELTGKGLMSSLDKGLLGRSTAADATAATATTTATTTACVDVTEEEWFENERNGSLDATAFEYVQRQLFQGEAAHHRRTSAAAASAAGGGGSGSVVRGSVVAAAEKLTFSDEEDDDLEEDDEDEDNIIHPTISDGGASSAHSSVDTSGTNEVVCEAEEEQSRTRLVRVRSLDDVDGGDNVVGVSGGLSPHSPRHLSNASISPPHSPQRRHSEDSTHAVGSLLTGYANTGDNQSESMPPVLSPSTSFGRSSRLSSGASAGSSSRHSLPFPIAISADAEMTTVERSARKSTSTGSIPGGVSARSGSHRNSPITGAGASAGPPLPHKQQHQQSQSQAQSQSQQVSMSLRGDGAAGRSYSPATLEDILQSALGDRGLSLSHSHGQHSHGQSHSQNLGRSLSLSHSHGRMGGVGGSVGAGMGTKAGDKERDSEADRESNRFSFHSSSRNSRLGMCCVVVFDIS